MSSLNPIVTVVTAVYNGEDYIEETILSVLSAARNIEFEYIVVNDGSTDSTLRILEKFKGQIKIIDKANSGESESVTIAFGEALGEYLIVVRADDPLPSEKLFEKSLSIS
jgi:glycosyltransferase involved in cell wall biosynthesis